jgi:pimeloyl-ACP methyl ester carboxylesterase
MRMFNLALWLGCSLFAMMPPTAGAASSGPAPQSLSMQSLGLKLAYLRVSPEKPEGRRTPVFIVHGIGGHKEDWTSLLQAVGGSRQAVAMDMIGFGGSDKSSPGITITQQANALRDLMDKEAAPRAVLVGNSLGAWVVATFAAKYPDRVERLILVDAAGLKVTLSGPPPVKFAPETVDEMQQLLQTVLTSPWAQSREFAEKALAGFKASGEAQTLQKLFAGFADKASPDRPLDDLLPRIKVPTLVIWGAQDKLFPPPLADVVVQGLTAAPGGVRKVLVPDAGHFPQVDNAAFFNQSVLQYLDGR